MATAGTEKVNNDEKDVKGEPPLPGQALSPGRDGKEDWIGRQLRRVFDDALNEPLPDDIMSLLERIDDNSGERSKSGE
ncbi:hypothetical protein SAMN02745157_4616 [Kaistia soli DSM 19436]|uniref:Anti-sigma factor NepR domain-containing protein n=1 Tax=Kaistia soli DSM 19436 TaxID=1122133 RepID=A0A1M5LJB6_9HYPH|nr:NepR family anti-sigma factor [Kaistia soli]SHG65212.1 hypothetical protein SAMN02745157_4616 [Kaistia soli DSM 19436]